MLGIILAEIATEYPEVYDVVEEIEDTATNTNGLPISITTIKFIILFAILIVIGAVVVFHPTAQNKKDAKKFLESLISKIYSIAVANLEYVRDDATGEVSLIDFDAFKKEVIEMIYKDAWDYVETSIDKSVTNGKLDFVTKRLIKRSNVESLVDLVMKRRDIDNMLAEIYDALTNATFANMIANDKKAAEEAAKAEAEPVDDPEPASTETVESFVPSSTPTEEELNTIEEPADETESGTVDINIMEDGRDDGSGDGEQVG